MCFVTAVFHYLANRDPRKFVRIGHPLSVSLILEIIAFFFSVQMFYVAPQLLSNAGLYMPSWIVAVFIMHNILGNMWACHSTKSSVACLSEDRRVPAPGEEHLWHYCDACQAMMPPRSWHCKLCEVCILKRDHHCAITATCIGLHNHRYFFWFILYLGLGSFLGFMNTILYVVQNNRIMVCFAQRFVPFDLRASCNGIFIEFIFARALLLLNMFALAACLITVMFQVQFVWTNTTFFTPVDPTYDLGFRENFRLVLGQRGLWTMLSPAIRSPMLHDGTQWPMKQSLAQV